MERRFVLLRYHDAANNAGGIDNLEIFTTSPAESQQARNTIHTTRRNGGVLKGTMSMLNVYRTKQGQLCSKGGLASLLHGSADSSDRDATVNQQWRRVAYPIAGRVGDTI